MAETEKYKAQEWRSDARHAFVRAETFSLELGHLRALVAACEGMPDKASVTFEGASKDYTRVDEWTAKVANVRHQEATR